MQEKLNSWLSIAENSDFSIYNLPYSIFSTAKLSPRIGIAIGDAVIDLSVLVAQNLVPELQAHASVCHNDYLNQYIALGKETTSAVRGRIQTLLCNPNIREQMAQALVKRDQVRLHLPVQVGDYTDFYSSIEHATNVGKMFRDPENALLPNWRHIPVGYHGRASSIIESGVPIHRPMGQTKLPEGAPVYGASARLDFELEMAFIIGKENALGQSISTGEAEDYIFGMVLFNDWSARDVQKWEYVPLGPFLAKNFASSISPWVVPLEALEPFRVSGPVQEPEVLPYLQYQGARNYDINLEVAIQTPSGSETTVSHSNFKYMYWNMAQQLAHHTMNGCNVRVGDMMASGTISGKDEQSYGSMLELAWAGK